MGIQLNYEINDSKLNIKINTNLKGIKNLKRKEKRRMRNHSANV